MKILIAGIGKVGKTLVEQFAEEGYDLTVLDTNKEALERIVEICDVITVNGNCASMEVLTEAEVGKADLLIAATGSDEINLLCCAAAHSLCPTLNTIARIRNPEYSKQVYRMRDVFSLSMIFNPERQAAAEIDRLLHYPGFLKRESFAKGRMEIAELKVEEGSKLANASLTEIGSLLDCKILVCAVLRAGTCITPAGDFVLKAGDRIFVTATANDLSALLKNLGVVHRKVRSAMVIGGGLGGYYLAESLLEHGIHVKLVERDAERCRELSALLPKADIIYGDGTSQKVLDAEGLRDCDALVALTGNDETNILISLYGKSYGVPQIITNLGRVEDMNIIDTLPLGCVVSPRKLCCNTIVRYARAIHHKTGAAIAVHSIADGQAEAIEFVVDMNTKHFGEPLKNIRLKPNIRIAGINRADKTEIAGGDSIFGEGDTIVLVTSRDEVLLELNDIFAD